MKAMIPGAYEPRPVRTRQPASIGGSSYGTAAIPTGLPVRDTALIADRQREGGRVTSRSSWLRRLFTR